ncbi:MAG TPA: hypothetical protein VF453_05675, partial [Burkholderiaceae bacterium]
MDEARDVSGERRARVAYTCGMEREATAMPPGRTRCEGPRAPRGLAAAGAGIVLAAAVAAAGASVHHRAPAAKRARVAAAST